jgi:lipopolysaccharide export system permease protein
MNNILVGFILKNFFKSFIKVVLIIYCFGIILNLFEEIEFFKNTEVGIFLPVILASIFVPSMIIKLLPFIIFISSMWFMIKIRNNKDLLILKIHGYSNIRIFFILACTSFLIGWSVLFIVNPFTSSMVKYYESTKAKYARDIDHLVSFNKNGLWIKESLKNGERIITAKKTNNFILSDVTIFEFNKNYSINNKVFAKKADINSNDWILSDVTIFKPLNGLLEKQNSVNYKINSIYNYEKIISLFNNSDTMSFLDLITNHKKLINNGYNKEFLNQSLHSMLVLPFFLFLMTSLASILTMSTLQKSENFKLFIVGLVICILVYYLKDLSIALGKTDRIPLTLSIWTPIIALSLFTFIGVLQINEK